MQQYIEILMTYFMFTFVRLSSTIVARHSHYRTVVGTLEFFVFILIMFTSTGYFFDVFLILLCDNSYLLPHKNKQFAQAIKTSMIYLINTFVNHKNIIESVHITNHLVSRFNFLLIIEIIKMDISIWFPWATSYDVIKNYNTQIILTLGLVHCIKTAIGISLFILCCNRMIWDVFKQRTSMIQAPY